MFSFLGRFSASHPWWICTAWLLLGVGVALMAPDAGRGTQDDDVRFLPDRCPSVRGYKLLQESFPQDVFASRVLFAVQRSDGPLTEADLHLVDGMAADLNQLKDAEPALQIGRIVSYRQPFLGKRLLSEDGRCTLLQVSLATPYMALQTAAAVDRAEQVVRKRLTDAGAAAPQLYVTGHAGVGRDLVRASAHGLDSTTLATIILVIVILLAVYRAPLLALVPLVTIAGSVWVALKVLALCTVIPGFYLVNTSQIFAVVMLYGAGTDYCLFLISRYREELAAGRGRDAALTRAVGSVGGALAASAGTVICGLGMMAFAEFAKVRSGGPAIAIGLGVALAASLTLAPALLRLLGPVVFWPRSQGISVASQKEGALTPVPGPLAPSLWGWLSRQVTTRPIAIFAASVAVLLPLAVLGFQVHAAYRATGELAPACQSVVGLSVVESHFKAGEVGPITVLLESSRPWEGKEGEAVIRHLSMTIQNLDNVAEVRSWTQPLGEPLADPPPDLNAAKGGVFGALMNTVRETFTDPVRKGAHDVYLAKTPPPKEKGKERAAPRWFTRLDVVLKTDPFDPKSNETLGVIERCLDQELPRCTAGYGAVRAESYGVTVGARDLADVTESDRLRINALVLVGVFLILMVLVRRPWLAAYLLGTVLLSYYATLGATTLAAWTWYGRPLCEVDWRVPFFLFTILVAVGEDYNILLVTRMLQERKRHGTDEGTRRALRHTGGAITSCGLIMAGTFATLMLAGLNTLVQIGFALAFGVLLDTFVVRPFLVPAFTLLMWRREDGRKAAAPKKIALLRRAG
ncbi:MAG TPA: MMPL family transporter [Gemmataceae bacterium]|nr:MMPL family transporter [Gemmataceae bacterium]